MHIYEQPAVCLHMYALTDVIYSSLLSLTIFQDFQTPTLSVHDFFNIHLYNPSWKGSSFAVVAFVNTQVSMAQRRPENK